MPAIVPTKKATTSGLTKEERQKRQKKLDSAMAVITALSPAGGLAALLKKGARPPKHKDDKSWNADTVTLKKGGKVKKYVKGGTVRKGKSKK